MKITNIKAILTTVAVAAFALLAAAKIEANNLPDVAVVIAYIAVGSMFVIASLDSRRGSKSYLTR